MDIYNNAFPMQDNTLFDGFGLTKREIYAMAAMQGLLANDTKNYMSPADIAKKAVEHADALRVALENDNG